MRIATAIERMAPLAVVVAVALALPPSRADAQGSDLLLPEPPSAPTDDAREVARAAFLEGIALAEQSRWDAALDAFERSYRLSGATAALFNLASTLRSLGRLRLAGAALDRLLSDPSLDGETLARASQLRSEIAQRVAYLTVDGVPDGRAEVLVDGRAREPTIARPVEIELDPGLRVVRIELTAHPPFSWSDEVVPGARLAVDAELEAPPVTPRAEPRDQDDTLLIGGLTGGLAGALVIALVVGLAVGLTPSLAPRTSLVIALP